MSDDLIKRSDAIKAFTFNLKGERIPFVDCDNFPVEFPLRYIVDTLAALPSADRPQGEWIDKGRNLWECSNCGMGIYSESEKDRNEFHKWCSRCGAQMKGADDE